LLEASGLKVKFRIDIRAGTGKNILSRLKEVGCEVVGFGIESGCEKTLQRINKKTTKQKVLETIEICRALDYWLIGFFMLSLPDENRREFQETLDISKYFDVFNFQFFKIHPNTMFYEELKAKGEIDDRIWFDQSQGAEIFYSKERFPSAMFYRNDIVAVERSVYKKHDLRRPGVTFRRYGLVKGLFVYLSAIVQLTLLSNGISAALLDRVKNGWLGKLLRARRFVK
jgi:radical SAM superfamily enzyme YgiQ (UPF0313 family)